MSNGPKNFFSKTTSMLAAVLLVGATVAAVEIPLHAEPVDAQACAPGTTPNTITWGAGGVVWNDAIQNSGLSRTYTNLGGSGVDMTMAIDDPSGMNEDGDNVLINLPTADTNWDPPFYTRTDGAYGPGYLTAVMTSLNSDQEVTFTLDFSAPVHLPAFSIGDVDFSGNNTINSAIPHDSFQDEILFSAQRNGVPVGFTGTTGTASSPTITLNDAANGQFRVAGGPYNDFVNGNLNPGDAGGTVTLTTLDPVTSISFAYSNGPHDAIADANNLAAAGGNWPLINYAAPMTSTDVGVSNNHAVRINIFTLCTGSMTLGDTVWADVDGDGVHDAGEPGIPGVTVTLVGQDGLSMDSVVTDANGNYTFTNLPPWDYSVVISNTPAGYTNTFDRDTGTTAPDGNSGTITMNGSDVLDADFGLMPPLGTIAGTVFADRGNDGSLDAGDTGLGGITMNLSGTDLAGNPITASTTTAVDGTYSFLNVPAGNYTVTESQPASYTDGIDTAGTNASNSTNDEHDVVLGLGQSSLGNDFAEIATGSIAGSVFEDDNNNAQPNGSEAGIVGVTVTLTGTDDGGNAVSLTTTTDANGDYIFETLRPGNYTVTETQPAGYLDGKDDVGSNGGDAATVNDEISSITLPLGVAAADYDFGEVEEASISGTVEDQHGNGIPNTTITLTGVDDLGAVVNTTIVTDANGDYTFDGLRPGTYVVTETQPTGYSDGPDSLGSEGGNDSTNDEFSAIALGSGVAAVNYDFVETSSSIAGTVVDDFGNGIPNTTITLSGTDANGATVSETTTTNSNGDYVFEGLLSGTYTVTETQPTGYGDGGETAGSEGGDDSANDVISGIALPAGTASVDNDFDETTSSIAGSVFEDRNNDGEPDVGEDGISGVLITLTGTDANGASVSVTTFTDSNGDYSFDNLLAGTYTVTESQPLSHADGKDDAGSEDGNVSANDVISAIVLGGGVDATDYDFGELEPSTLGGTVFEDDNNNGTQEASEDGIEGVTVTLTGADDLGNSVNLSTTTDVDGNYSFGTLRPGNYTVTETQPAAYLDGIDTAGTSGGDSTANDIVSAIDLHAFTNATDYDFGELPLASIAGSVVDDSGNPIENVTITLTGTDDLGDPVTATTTTDSSGDYSFTGLRPGNYTVTETQPVGYGDGGETVGSEGGDNSVDDIISGIILDSGDDSINNDFDETTSSLAGSVFEDNNNNGTQDGTEDPIDGVTVRLTGTDDLGNLVDRTTTTDIDGDYIFDDLISGTYTVIETQPTSYLDGIDTAGTSLGNDTAVNDEISAVALAGGIDATGYDFGELNPASIAGSVVDDFGNPIENVTITLTGTDDLGDPVTATTTTDSSGDYSFTGLRPGNYTVTETQPVGYGDGGETVGSEGGDNSVDDIISGIILDSGDDSINNDFDETTSSLAGSVFEDNNNNGQPDVGDAGIAGVTVTLTGTDAYGASVSETTTTDVNGDYVFENLLSGTYIVTETQPSSHADGADDAGSEGGNDTAVNDQISAISLGDGVDATDYDFGELSLSSLAGTVYEDDNNNGTQEGSEAGINDVTVTLTGTDDLGNPVTATTTTDTDGNYSFGGLRPGAYTVTETHPAAYLDGIDAAGTSGGDASTNDVISTINLAAFTDATGYDFGELPPASINGSVVDDFGNPIENVTVTLTGTDDLGNPVTTTTTTNPSGNYNFDDLRPGNYTVTETQPVGYGDGGETAGSEGGVDTTDDVISEIILAAGDDSINNDFDETTSSLAGSVFEDDNNNGTQDGTEDPIDGVTVQLSGTDDRGNLVDLTTTTDVNGDYLFENLIAGTYTVTETQPAAYLDGIDTAGTSGGNDSAVNDAISAVGLAGGVDATGYDFGELKLASIAGSVIDDFSAPISNVTLTLSGTDDLGNSVTATTTTDANGDYIFTGLRPGDYIVTETQPLGYGDGGETAGSEGGDASVDDVISAIILDAGVDSIDNDFAEVTGSLTGSVFEDTNNDGQPDGGEAGIAGVTVELSGTDVYGNSVTATTVTDASGDYFFDHLIAGTYTVNETQPASHIDGKDDAGSEAGDATSVNDEISDIALGDGVDATDYDFGEIELSSLAGTVFEDDNNNGTQEGSEAGISDVTIDLTGTDDLGNAVTATTTTDADGNYVFDGLRPGDYIITETQPTSHLDGIDTAGSEGGDATTTNDQIATIALAPFVDGTDYDFGELRPGSIGGSVVDDFGNPIENVTLTLEGVDDLGNVVSATTTSVTGDYEFADLRPGTYTVTETQPDGYGDGGETAGSEGGDDTIDDVISGITIDAGVDSTDNDFDETTGSLSGTVFVDANNDGEIDLGETGITGVTVELTGTDDLGNPVTLTTTTDTNGEYLFENLVSGSYTVTETQPADYFDGIDDAGPAGGNDTATNDEISAVVVTPGDDAPENDFAELSPSSIGGTVVDDFDNPIENVTITLTGTDDLGASVTLTTTTDFDGAYIFEDLRPGTYTVTETQPLGYGDGGETPGTVDGDETPDGDGSVDDVISTIVLPPATDATGYDFDETTATISGNVFHDRGNDGVSDAGDVPIQGVELTLTGTDDLGNPVTATTTTDADGNYEFENLISGIYTVVETQPPAYEDGIDTVGSTGGDGTTVNDEISGIVVTPGDESTDNNFAEVGNVIDGTVWIDTNENGVIDPEEANRLEGIELTLTDDQGVVVGTTTTDEFGNYVFPSVPAGNYTVTQEQPGDYGTTTPNSLPITVPVGGLSDVDFGEDPAAIYGVVWDDNTDPDGVQDAGEPGIGGVTVNLLDPNGTVVATTTTESDGSYSFEDLPAGEYTAVIELPDDTTVTSPNSGTDDTVDSDFTYVTETTAVNVGRGETVEAVDAGLVEEDLDVELEINLTSTPKRVTDDFTFEVVTNNGGNTPVEGGVDVTVDIPSGVRVDKVIADECDGSNSLLAQSATADTTGCWIIDVSSGEITGTWTGILLPGESPPPIVVEATATSAGTIVVSGEVATSDGSTETVLSNNDDAERVSVDELPALLAFTGGSTTRLLLYAIMLMFVGFFLLRSSVKIEQSEQ